MQAARRNRPVRVNRFRKYWPYYLMMLPGLLYFLINNYLPMPGIILAFKKVNWRLGIFGSKWNGLKNFSFLISSGMLGTIVRNTVLYNLAFIVIGTVLAITVAILLNEVRSRAVNRVFQTLILLPYLMSMVVVSYLTYAFLSVETGYVNNAILPALGMNPIRFYQEPKYWPAILILVNTWKDWWRPWLYIISFWKEVGWGAIIYVSALSGVDMEQHEAATVDGANRLQRVIHVTLPSISGTIMVVFILNLAKILNLFDPVWVLQNSMVIKVSDVIETYVYRMGISGSQYGLSTAAGLFKSVISVVFVILGNRLSKAITGEKVI